MSAKLASMTSEFGSAERRQCGSCHGTGEVGTDSGVVDCPDCGGEGVLPDANVLVEWRMRDIERAHEAAGAQVASDIRWLVAELRRSRKALVEVVTLAQEPPNEELVKQVGVVAGDALCLFEVHPVNPSLHAKS